MKIKILSYIRKDTSTLLVFSAAIALLVISPLLPLSNPILLQPVQAQTTMTFKTLSPAIDQEAHNELEFHAQGTTSTSDPSSVDITNGTILWQEYPPTGNNVTANIKSGTFKNNTRGGEISFTSTLDNVHYMVVSECSTSENNLIIVDSNTGLAPTVRATYTGPVECSSSSQGGNSTTQSSSSPGTTTTTQQDSDGDGIPDSSDKCLHTSNSRCFKEGDTSSTTTTQQEQPPSSNRTGNQTR